MVDSIIVCAPRFDDVTEYCFEESRDLIKYAEKEGVNIYDLPGEQAIRENLEKAIEIHPEALIYHTDHGSPDKAWGDDDRPVLDLKNAKILAGKEAFMNNCSSAKELGKKAYQEGCKAYWGNTDIVSFTTDAWEDFKEAFLHGLKLRIRGYSWKDCLTKTKEKLNQFIDKLVGQGKFLAAACMRSFRDTLVCYTPETPPEESECPVRQIALNWFGPKIGWQLSRAFPVSIALFFLGLGILLHDYWHALWQVGGYGEILSLQGGYFGAIILVIGFVLAYYQVWKLLKR